MIGWREKEQKWNGNERKMNRGRTRTVFFPNRLISDDSGVDVAGYETKVISTRGASSHKVQLPTPLENFT
jgi:hypothetical protein